MSDFPNWFEITARANFERFLLPHADEEPYTCLQLGVFTGDASVWMLENLPKAHLTDVDPWTDGSETIEHFDYPAIYQYYRERTEAYGPGDDRLATFRGTSDEYLFWGDDTEVENDDRHDFIYIDADHRAPNCLADAVGSFRLLRPGGLMAFDDYTWDSGHGLLHNPRIAIDAFIRVYEELIDVLEINSQAWVQKKNRTPPE